MNYEDIGKTDDSIVKTEGAAFLVSLKNLLEIIKADSAVVKFGAVTHHLDDNLAALHHLAEQIQKDYKPPPKR